MALEMKQKTKKTEESNLNEIIITDPNTGNQLAEYDTNMLGVIKNTVANGASDEELYMFLNVATSYQLNPFKKEIWWIKRGDTPTIMTSRDGYLQICRRNPDFKGVQSFAVYENDNFEMKISIGEIQDVIHEFQHKDRGPIVGAWAVARSYTDNDVYTYVAFEDYNTGKSTWVSYKEKMIRKVAETDVLKRFGGISGLATMEEMPPEYADPDTQQKNKQSRAEAFARAKAKCVHHDNDGIIINDDEIDDFIDAQIITSEMPPLKYSGDENVEKGE